MINKIMYVAVPLAGVALLMAACTENPVDGDEHGAHAEAEAMLVTMGSDTLLHQHEDQGILTKNGITVTTGEETAPITVQFGDHEDDLFQPAEDHFSLNVTSDDPEIAEVHTAGNRWEFTLKGKSQGSTSIEVKLMHGDHPDFTGEKIQVNVSG